MQGEYEACTVNLRWYTGVQKANASAWIKSRVWMLNWTHWNNAADETVWSSTVQCSINAFENKWYRKILLGVSCTEHRTNQFIVNDLGVTFGTLLNFIKKQKLSYFGHIQIHQTLNWRTLWLPAVFWDEPVPGQRFLLKLAYFWTTVIINWLNQTSISLYQNNGKHFFFLTL